MKKLVCSMAVALCACGPVWSGKVSGYALDVNEALFTPLTDSKGASLGAMVVLSDQGGLCALLAAAKPPPNATVATFSLLRQADGKLLSPDVGDYVVGASTAAAASATGQFIRTDSNGTNAIPAANRVAASGRLEVTELSVERGVLNARFDGKFGVQSDGVTAAFSAQRCFIDSQSLLSGFLGRGEGPAGSNPIPSGGQSRDCADFVACYRALAGTSSSVESTYGPNGTCWSGSIASADACSQGCRDGLQSIRQSSGAPSVCFQ